MTDDAKKTMLAILQEAVRSEDLGHEFYHELAARTQTPESRDLYLRLADEEKNHERELQSHYDRYLAEVGWKPYEGASVYKFLDHFRERLPFLSKPEKRWAKPAPDAPFVDAVRFALEAERASVQFYLQAAAHITDIDAKEFFTDLARFEIGHVRALEAELIPLQSQGL